jgi:hypothetical protein
MAIISLIQGTDRLSASRVTLNDNMTAINDELNDVVTLLNPTTLALSGVSTIETNALSVAAGGAAEFATTGNTLAVDTLVEGVMTLDAGVVYGSAAVAVSMPGALGYASSTYLVSAASVNLDQALDGQEITIIADGIQVTVDATLIGGVSSVVLDPYGTITLRYVGSTWYVIAASPINASIA